MGREFLSRIRAQLFTLLGIPRGFFIQYDHAGSVPAPSPYSEVEAILVKSDYSLTASNILCYLDEVRATDARFRRRKDSRMFGAVDGLITYGLVKSFRPQNIVEIGSGESTHWLASAAHDDSRIVCLDPAPRRSIDSLPVTFIKRILSDEDVDLFDDLYENDILFIDSSHILMPGTDVDILFNRVLPRLRPGVVVHVHDIFLPDDYPKTWEHRQWNEQCALASWVLSGAFEVVFPVYYVLTRRPELLRDGAGMLPTGPDSGGSFWMRKR